MLKFEDPNKGPRRLLPEDEQDLGEGLRIELDRLVSLLHPASLLLLADAITEERARARLERLRRVRRSISEFVTSSPATIVSPAPFSVVALAARVKVMARRLDDLCFSKLRVCDVTIPLCVESPTSSANPR